MSEAETRRILWLDNDIGHIRPYEVALRRSGYDVTAVTSPIVAEGLLATSKFDLLILDVMLPTTSAEEEVAYPPEVTQMGLGTGLLFYERNRASLMASGTSVLALSVRLDKDIRERFLRAGLPPDHFSTKLELRETPTFLERIQAIISTDEKARPQGGVSNEG